MNSVQTFTDFQQEHTRPPTIVRFSREGLARLAVSLNLSADAPMAEVENALTALGERVHEQEAGRKITPAPRGRPLPNVKPPRRAGGARLMKASPPPRRGSAR